MRLSQTCSGVRLKVTSVWYSNSRWKLRRMCRCARADARGVQRAVDLFFATSAYTTGDLVQFCTRLPALAGTHVLRAFERSSFHVPHAAAIRQQPTLFS